MYNRAFLFNGIGSKLGKLICNLTPELREKYETYKAEAFSFLGINGDLSDITDYHKEIIEWMLHFVCDRVVFEYFIEQGITPDIGMGYSSGIVIASACLGAIKYEDTQNIIMSLCDMIERVKKSSYKLDMGVVIGFSYDELAEMLKNKFSNDELIIGSGNSSFHTMICGNAEAVSKAVEYCTEEGAIKAFSMNIGAAFHHPIMEEVAIKSINICKSLDYADPTCPIMSVFDLKPLKTAEEIRVENVKNVYTPMRWDLAIKKLEKMGVREFIDISANGAVKKFSRVSRKCRIYTLEDVLSGKYQPLTSAEKKTKTDNSALIYANQSI